ncbi:MAG TPA: hypothetical protein PLW09_02635 [Candidatus Kapabacteria bacterium]|nr:hypothetical protein [Candidatus Kapabacteria bacterium]
MTTTKLQNDLTPEQHLLDGVKILSTYLDPLGFHFKLEGTGQSSGGHFAYGQFVNGDRAIELHYRWSLGLVSYKVGNLALGHEEYINLLDKHGQNQYPNYSDEPNDAFRCLRFDLENLLVDFTENNAILYKQKAPDKIFEIERQQAIKNNANKKIYSGDQRIIDQAKAEFKNGNYLQVDKLKRQIQHPDLLTETEKKIFELNDTRKKDSL